MIASALLFPPLPFLFFLLFNIFFLLLCHLSSLLDVGILDLFHVLIPCYEGRMPQGNERKERTVCPEWQKARSLLDVWFSFVLYLTLFF